MELPEGTEQVHLVLTRYAGDPHGWDPSAGRVITQAELELVLVAGDMPIADTGCGLALTMRVVERNDDPADREQITLLLNPPTLAWVAQVASVVLDGQHPARSESLEALAWKNLNMPIESTLVRMKEGGDGSGE